MTNKCAKCDSIIDIENSTDDHKVHVMVHGLIEQLNTMPPQYGYVAMGSLMVESFNGDKEAFLKHMSLAWNTCRGHENEKEKL